MRYLVLGNQLMNNISYRDLFNKPVENTTIINSKLHHPEQIYIPKLNNKMDLITKNLGLQHISN